MQLREIPFYNAEGDLAGYHYVDDDGAIIRSRRKVERFIEDGQRVFVQDPKKESDYEFGVEPSLGRNPEHIKIYRTNVQYILANLSLSKDARCAFLSCIAYVDWNSNFVVDPSTKEPLSGRQIAELTNLDRNTMQRGLKELKEFGIVAFVSSGSKQNYMVNPNLTWKGKRIAKDINQSKHFKGNGLKLPTEIKYSQGLFKD